METAQLVLSQFTHFYCIQLRIEYIRSTATNSGPKCCELVNREVVILIVVAVQFFLRHGVFYSLFLFS